MYKCRYKGTSSQLEYAFRILDLCHTFGNAYGEVHIETTVAKRLASVIDILLVYRHDAASYQGARDIIVAVGT